MAYSPEVIAAARARLRQAKADREQTQLAHREEAYRAYPRLAEIDLALRGTMARAVSAALSHGEDAAAALEAARQENLALQREREWIIDASDLEEGYLDESPLCADCGGDGYIGQEMCSCLRELCRQEQRKALSNLLNLGGERFEDFRLEYYSEAPDATFGISPRENMRAVYRKVRSWAQNFTPGAGNLLLTGGTGLGKTYLSACAAQKVADAGYSVVYETAAKLLSDFEAEKFGGEAEGSRTRKYFGCDLLILDDLGTEMTTQFVISALYQLVNTRLMSKKSVIVSTNLSLDQIRSRYGVQLYSRLAGEYEGLLFFGDDIRLQRR